MTEEHAALVAAVARNKDKAAFTRLFDHFAPRVNGYLTRMGVDAGQAEEITQDTLAVLWHKAGLFDPGRSSLSTWLYRIARNRRIDGLRRDRLVLFDPLDLPDRVSDEAPQDDAYDARDRAERLRAALGDLPAEQRVLVELAFYQGLSHSEVAERANLPLGTVKSRLRLAFGRLRKALVAGGVAEAE